MDGTQASASLLVESLGGGRVTFRAAPGPGKGLVRTLRVGSENDLTAGQAAGVIAVAVFVVVGGLWVLTHF